MQSLWNFQGTKDAGCGWHQLYANIVTRLEQKPNTINKGVRVYIKQIQRAYLILSTDDSVYMSKGNETLNKLLDKFGDFFSFKVKIVIELIFLYFRIIQTKQGNSIDQSNHITQSILNEYFDKDEQFKYQSSPFPLDSKL